MHALLQKSSAPLVVAWRCRKNRRKREEDAKGIASAPSLCLASGSPYAGFWDKVMLCNHFIMSGKSVTLPTYNLSYMKITPGREISGGKTTKNTGTKTSSCNPTRQASTIRG
jgi:hypothetical protein